MRILLIKLSSLGDVFHTFPALSDAQKAIPGITFDWLVEETFSGLAVQHPAVDRAIPVRFRKLKRANNRISRLRHHWRDLKNVVAPRHYDLVLDAQGLLKSAILTRLTPAPAAGFGFGSAREALAVPFYKKTIGSKRNQHAIRRTRQLFAGALGYDCPDTAPDYGLDREVWAKKAIANLQTLALPLTYTVFLHGAAWQTKTWPQARWREMAVMLNENGTNIFLPWNNKAEKARAEYIADGLDNVRVLPRLSIVELAHILSRAEAVIGVDSGLGHIPVAFDIPGLVLIGPTDPAKIGHEGSNQMMIQSSYARAPCYRRTCKDAEKNRCCMAAIGVDEVKTGVRTLLASSWQ